MPIVLNFRTFGQRATVTALVTVAFPPMTNPWSIPKTNWLWRPLGHTTSGAVRTVISALVASHLAQLDHQVARRGRACPTLPGSAAMYTEGTASRPPTAKGLAGIGVRPGSAGPAVRPCGISSGVGFCRAANKIIRIIMGHAAQPAARWKNRKAGEQALRYLFSCVPRGAAGGRGQGFRDRGLFLRGRLAQSRFSSSAAFPLPRASDLQNTPTPAHLRGDFHVCGIRVGLRHVEPFEAQAL